jgi:neutral ceramidase
VGVAQIDITPEAPIRLTGYGSRSTPSERVAGRLRAKALAFGGARGGPAVLITADLIGVPRYMVNQVAARLRKAGVEPEQLAISATHTHTGPALSKVLPFIFNAPMTADEDVVVDRYSAVLVDKLERVALAALADRRPSRVEWGRGSASFAVNRRVLKDGKWAAFGVTPDGAVDRDLPVLAVRGVDGSLRAVLVSYACHATTLEGKENFVHGDWPAASQALIEERHPGAIALVAIGTGADANPNPRGGGLADVDRHAREIASEVDRVIAGKMTTIGTPPRGRLRSIALPLAAIPARADWEAQAKQKGASGIFARSILGRMDRAEPIATTVDYPIQTWTFGGDLAMVFLGGEVVADYGLRLKGELDPARLWVNAYSNDVAFYVASKRMISEGGYEVAGSMIYYGQPSRLGEETEELIVQTVRELLPVGFRRTGGS